MTTGVTYRNWRGKPALTQDGQARVVLSPGGEWTPPFADEAAGFLAVSRDAASIGEGKFADMFEAWKLPDLDGWYQRRDPARPYDSYAKARRAAFR